MGLASLFGFAVRGCCSTLLNSGGSAPTQSTTNADSDTVDFTICKIFPFFGDSLPAG